MQAATNYSQTSLSDYKMSKTFKNKDFSIFQILILLAQISVVTREQTSQKEPIKHVFAQINCLSFILGKRLVEEFGEKNILRLQIDTNPFEWLRVEPYPFELARFDPSGKRFWCQFDSSVSC